MALNTIGRCALDGLFIVLIGTFGWVVQKADTKIETHEIRLRATEVTAMRIETKLDYAIKTLDEIKVKINGRY